MRVLFADIDGVLVNRRSWYVRSGAMATADPPCVLQLNRIVAATQAKVVISSTWRIGRSVETMRRIFREFGIVADIVGLTPHYNPTFRRGDEIRGWLNASIVKVRDSDLAIVDDDADMGDLLPRLVQTRFDVGLTESDADRAIALLEGR